MKFLLGFLVLIVATITSVIYTPYFTDALKPYIEKEIEKQINFDITVASLKLHLSSFELKVLITPKNSIDIDGTYAPTNGKIQADYIATLDNLEALKEHIGYELYGSAIMQGSFTFLDNHLSFDMNSDIYDGIVQATYENSEIQADFSKLQSIKILKMLQYPEVINSEINGTLIYNTEAQKGVLKSNFNSAHLAKNSTMDLLEKLAEYNIYEAEFSGKLHADINKNISISTLELQAPNASIASQKIHIDSKANTIDTNLHVIANKYPFDIKVSGNLKKPNVSLDTKEVLKNELGRYLNHLIKELF